MLKNCLIPNSFFILQEKAEEILEDSPEGQRLRFLENEIHKTNLKLMEGETIKKKYMTILDMLKKERLTFGNQIEGLEAQLRKQEEEIERSSTRQDTIPMKIAINEVNQVDNNNLVNEKYRIHQVSVNIQNDRIT